MKKLLLPLLLGLTAVTASAQTYINRSQGASNFGGFIRKAPCGNGAGDSCGDNPPTWHLTPDACGIVISTGAARNSDGSTFSSKGVRYTLPTVAEFVAANMGNGAGAPGSSGYANREAQCEISFVMGAPGPENYLEVGFSDSAVGLTDKFTPFAGGGYDIANGYIRIPYRTPGVITFNWNGNSWLAKSATPALAEMLDMGQTAAHGQGRLFQVTADPSWWSVGSNIGKLAFCPVAGMGIVTNSNGGDQLTVWPYCVYRDNVTTTSVTDLIVYRKITTGTVSNLTQGAAYGASTAQNGEAYAAGNYPVLTVGTALNFSSGDVIEVHNILTTLGTKLDGRWIGKLLTAGVDTGCSAATTCIELHERMEEGASSANRNGVGAPAAFVAGDSLLAGQPSLSGRSFHYASLGTAAISAARETSPVTGVDRESTSHLYTIVGIARRTSGTGYQNTTALRHVASLYHPKEVNCLSTTGGDRTTSSTTFAEVNSDMRCQFVSLNGSSAKALELGDNGRNLRYSATIGSANNTAGDGCEYTVGFGVGAGAATAETPIAGFVNPAGVAGGRQTVTLNGQKATMLSEVGQTFFYVTLMHRAVTGGTCTTFSGSTNLNLYLWQ